MNPVLVESIRRRMVDQSTEQLLALWTTNDRAMWSAEAFEAIKSLLAERGVRELPPQEAPAPVAQLHSSAKDPVAQYWLGWLRPLLWVCVGVAVTKLPQALLLVGSVALAYAPDPLKREVRAWVPAGEWWLWQGPLALWFDQILPSVLPLWLLVASVGCLRLARWARPALLVYAAAAAVLGLATSVLRFREVEVPFANQGVFWAIQLPTALADLAQSLVLPVLIWTLFRRPEIRSAFVPASSGRAFEALPVADGTAPLSAP